MLGDYKMSSNSVRMMVTQVLR